METQRPELIQAAGGLLWREHKSRREVLVVHRRRYHDWVLPKGKVKEGESLQETALREVAEESGYRADLLNFAGEVFYYAEGIPKIVHYWNMQVVTEIPQKQRTNDSPDEGDKVRWLSVPEALDLISYEDEKELLKQDVQCNLPAFQTQPDMQFASWLERTIGEPSVDRLRNSLGVYYHEMGQLEAIVRAEGILSLHTYFEAIARLLQSSREAIKHNDVECGWGSFNAAQRIETLLYFKMSSLGTNHSLQSYAECMYRDRAEGVAVEGQSKLSGWRLKRIQSLLCDKQKETMTKVPPPSKVLLAQKVLTEHYENRYLRLEIINRQVRFLEVIAIVALVLWLGFLQTITLIELITPVSGLITPIPGVILTIFEQIHPNFEQNAFSSPLLLSILALIFGTLGASISGILRLEKRSRSVNERIPEQLESRAFMLARPVVGAVSALAVVFFVRAGIVSFGEETSGLYMAAAFAAGFSERLLRFGVEKVSGPENGEKQ